MFYDYYWNFVYEITKICEKNTEMTYILYKVSQENWFIEIFEEISYDFLSIYPP